jgi:vancomycin resistance protein YoaR
MTYRSRSPQTRKKGIPLLAVALVVLLLIAGGVGYWALTSLDGNSAPTGADTSIQPGATASAVPTDKGTFYNGVFVDGIALGGLTMDQARSQIEEQQKALVDTIQLEVTHAKGSLKITNLDVSYSFDTDAVLQKAFEQGRTGTAEEQQTAINNLPANPVKLTTTLTVDPSLVEQKVRDFAATLATPGTDASFKGIDMAQPAGQQLQFNPETPGTQVNPDTLWEQVKTAFAANQFGTLAAQDETLAPAVTVASLQADLQLVTAPDITGFTDAINKRITTNNAGHTYTTWIKNSAAGRLKNIELGNKAISGTLLMPGDLLSVNNKTGERTAAKGYQKAPVDQNGIEDVGLGGGMCQVSGTLYNAAIAAGPARIEIVEREHHSLPSAYMAKGTDATVDYPGKDFQFKNISGKPMLVVMFYAKGADGKYYEHADIYCVPEPEGAMYKLEGVVTSTIPGDDAAAPKKVPNNALQPGQTKLIPAHKGYNVDAFLVKIAKDGTTTKTKLYSDKYPASGPVLAYYAKDPKPTDTPSTTPSAEVTPAAPTPTPSVEPPASTEPAATTAG